MFGPRDASWKFVGIGFHENGPHLRYPPGHRLVSVELLRTCLFYPDQALYQLSHEVVHLLSPTGGRDAPLIEEGCAVHFSLTAPTYRSSAYKENSLRRIRTDPAAINYWEALEAFERLEAIYTGAVKRLRLHQPNFKAMEPALIVDQIPAVGTELAELLCTRRTMRPRTLES